MSESSLIGAVTGFPGRWFLTKFSRVIDQAAFFWLCLKVVYNFRWLGRRLLGRIIVQQIYFTAVQSVELVVFVALLMGVVLVIAGISSLAALGGQQALNLILIKALMRELGPMLTAIIIILRSGSAITVEMGYMNVLGEIEGLEMQGVSTLHLLCIPRLIGATISVICLMILFDFAALGGGFVAARIFEGIPVWLALSSLAAELQFTDFVIVFTKGLCFGAIIPAICLHNGFQAEEAITNIPPKVSRALVECFLYMVLFNLLISGAAFISGRF